MISLTVSLAGAASVAGATEAQLEALENRVENLRGELAAAEQALQAAQSELSSANEQNLQLQGQVQDYRQRQETIKVGPLSIGGALRVNYVYGSYETSDDGPGRGGHGGNIELDTYRLNLGLDYNNIIGKFEYRWYTAGQGKNYNFMHTGWLGYRFDESSHVEVGLNRVPFGAGPYGISQSWFFDQNYYVGLSDDPDLGIKYSTRVDDWNFDLAYYWRSEPSFSGRSTDSARYGYDAVRWRESISESGEVLFDDQRSGYREKNQFNIRAIRKLKHKDSITDFGLSLQYGELDGSQIDDGDHWAASAHVVHNMGNWTLAGQLSRYVFDIDGNNPWGTDELIPMGAYDFAWPVASRAWLPAISLSYKITTEGVPWLDYVLPYVEWSSILKDESRFNHSELFILGAAWARGGWYVYSDMAYSNGNYFIGNEGDDYTRTNGVGDFGVNGNDRWNYRLNLNFGYYY